jgi:hypothetical protein
MRTWFSIGGNNPGVHGADLTEALASRTPPRHGPEPPARSAPWKPILRPGRRLATRCAAGPLPSAIAQAAPR